jgi:hypothetical protein
MKKTVFWVVIPCSSELSFPTAYIGFLLGLLFDPKDGGDMLRRNVGFSMNYTALQPRRPYHSWSPP